MLDRYWQGQLDSQAFLYPNSRAKLVLITHALFLSFSYFQCLDASSWLQLASSSDSPKMRTMAMVFLLVLVFMCGVVWHLVSEREELMEKLQKMTALMLCFLAIFSL